MVTVATSEGVGGMVLATTAEHTGPAIRAIREDGLREWSYSELGAEVRALGRGLVATGLEPGDRICILAGTRPEWTIVDCAALAAGLTVVPIYHTNSPEECRYVLEHSGARAVVCEDAAQLEKVQAVASECPALEHVLTIDEAPGAPSLRALRDRGTAASGDELDRRSTAVAAGDVATIVYTSGTTGPPKGCMLTHGNLISTVRTYRRALDLDEGMSGFMFLPLAHSLARVVQFVALDGGGTLTFWGGRPDALLDDVARARPTHLPSVPRLFEKIHTRALAGVADAGGIREALFRRSVATGRRHRAAVRAGEAPGPVLRARHALADRLVLAKVRGLFGPDLQLALTGAAPISREVLDFFDACGVLILEGYGMTETCAAATLNVPGAFRFGSVGRALPGTEVAIAADGEVLMRGPNVFAGYFRDEDATRETVEGDGWLRSGDLGELDADGYLRITGRKKDLIITSSGKNISPTNLEAALRESRWISEAVVYGDEHPYLVALLTLDPEEAPALAAELGVDADPAAMAASPEVRAAIQAEVDAVNARFARIEQIKRFAILDRDLTQGAGELTPTLKVKRAAVYGHFRDTLEALYA
jgi:long-chain acyl-CoA synthetase